MCKRSMCLVIIISLGILILSGTQIYAQTQTGFIPILHCEEPLGAAYDPIAQKFYTANYWSEDIAVIDVENGVVDTAVTMAGKGIFIGIDHSNDRIYFGDLDANLHILSIDDYSEIASYSGITAQGFARNSLTNKVYIRGLPNNVFVFNGATGQLINTITVGNSEFWGLAVKTLAFDEVDNLLWVACNDTSSNQVDIIDCSADTVLLSIPMDEPRAIAINQSTRMAYVGCKYSVVKVDAATFEVFDTLDISPDLCDVAINEDNNKVYIAIKGPEVFVIDGESLTIDTVFTDNYTQAGHRAHILCDAVRNEIYLLDEGPCALSIFSTGDYNLIKEIPLRYNVINMTVDPQRNLAFLGARVVLGDGYIFKIDGETYEIVDTCVIDRSLFASSCESRELQITCDWIHQKLFAIGKYSQKIYSIDEQDMALISTHDIPGRLWSCHVNPVTGKVYANLDQAGQLLVFDGIEDEVETYIGVHAGGVDCEVNTVTNKIYVPCTTNYLDVIDGATNTLENSIFIPGNPWLQRNFLNETTNEIYLTSYNDCKVRVLDGNDYSIIATIDVAGIPYDGVCNPQTNRAFVPGVLNGINVIDGYTYSVVENFPGGGTLAINDSTGIIYCAHDQGVTIFHDDASGIPDIAVTPDTLEIYVGGEKHKSSPISQESEPRNYSGISGTLAQGALSNDMENQGFSGTKNRFIRQVPADTLYYDDGTMEGSLGIQSETPHTPSSSETYGFATRFEHNPTSLLGIMLYFGNFSGTSYRLYIWEDESGVPKSGVTPLYENDSMPTPAPGEWTYIDLESSDIFLPSIFWVGVCYNNLPTSPEWHLAYDSNTTDHHTYVNLGGSPFDWENLGNYNYAYAFGVRAVVATEGAPSASMIVRNEGEGYLSVSDINSEEEWIKSIIPTCFQVAAGDSQTVTVAIDTSGLSTGTYYGTIHILSNDPDENPYDVPVKLTVICVGVDETPVLSTKLNSNFPNPFSHSTTISFSLKEKSHVKLAIYNLKGQLVTTLVDEEMGPVSDYHITWDGKSRNKKLANGIYFYKLETANKSFIKKMILMR